jgi:hypothetical protein
MSGHEFSWGFSADFDRAPPSTTGARPHYGFPFWLGAVPAPVTVIPVVVPRWGTLAAASQGWQAASPAVQIHRFERIYTQPVATFGQSINFNFQVQSQFPFLIATGNEINISSTITSP